MCYFSVNHFAVDCLQYSQEYVNCYFSYVQSLQQVIEESRPALWVIDCAGQGKHLSCFVSNETFVPIWADTLNIKKNQQFSYNPFYRLKNKISQTSQSIVCSANKIPAVQAIQVAMIW